MISPRRISQ
ncbi:UNVERIFIED_CONTAM: hypothetical protein GTU68_023085 [Idotea baltica]|nr:hypothetical protein [Idotea baltica]